MRAALAAGLSPELSGRNLVQPHAIHFEIRVSEDAAQSDLASYLPRKLGVESLLRPKDLDGLASGHTGD